MGYQEITVSILTFCVMFLTLKQYYDYKAFKEEIRYEVDFELKKALGLSKELAEKTEVGLNQKKAFVQAHSVLLYDLNRLWFVPIALSPFLSLEQSSFLRLQSALDVLHFLQGLPKSEQSLYTSIESQARGILSASIEAGYRPIFERHQIRAWMSSLYSLGDNAISDYLETLLSKSVKKKVPATRILS